MRVSYLFGSALLVVAGFVHTAAQVGGCTLNASQSHLIRGLHLGMTTGQVSATHLRLPPLRANEFGQTKVIFTKEADEVAFAGVDSISLNFVDDRLVEFMVYYAGAPFDSMDQFLAQFRETLKLPGGWVGEGYTPRRLACDKFQIEVGASSYSAQWLSPYVRVTEVGAEEVVAQRAAEKRERQRQAFKP